MEKTRESEGWGKKQNKIFENFTSFLQKVFCSSHPRLHFLKIFHAYCLLTVGNFFNQVNSVVVFSIARQVFGQILFFPSGYRSFFKKLKFSFCTSHPHEYFCAWLPWNYGYQTTAQSAWDIPYLNRKIFLFRYQIFK